MPSQEEINTRLERVRHLLALNTPVSDIAEKLGVTTRTIERDKEKLGLSRKKRRITPSVIHRIRDLAAEGCPAPEIAEAVGVSRKAIYGYIRDIPTRHPSGPHVFDDRTRQMARALGLVDA